MRIIQLLFITGLILTSCGEKTSTQSTDKQVLSSSKSKSTETTQVASATETAKEKRAMMAEEALEKKEEMVSEFKKKEAEMARNGEKAIDKVKESMPSKDEMASKGKEMMDDTKEKVMDAGKTMADKAKATATSATDMVKTEETKVAMTEKPAVPEKPVVIKKVEDVPTEKVKKMTADDIHKSFDALLRKHVSSAGVVNYGGFKADQGQLDAYLDKISSTVPDNLSKKEKLAFWINAYNAFTVKKIISNYPLGSITDLDGGKPWDAKWIKINGKTYSLNNIENDIIRPTFNEPRIHFAVNCAAKSCPPLLNKAWTSKNLSSNFDKLTKSFINNPKYNQISADKVQISKIFEWYGGDFGDILTYLNKYSNTKINPGTSIEYLEYDWSLNGK